MATKAKQDSEAHKDRSPGEHLRAELSRLGLTQVAVSEATGVSRQSINNIINGRQSISRAMAGKLGRLTGRPSDYWLAISFPRETAGKKREPHHPLHGLLVNHEIIRDVTNGIITIDPFTPANVRAASIELTIGDVVLAGQNAGEDASKDALLEPGRGAIMSTRERIALPSDRLGRMGTTQRLATAGIVASLPLHLEPGSNGSIRFGVFNAGAAPFHLRRGDTVAILEILALARDY